MRWVKIKLLCMSRRGIMKIDNYKELANDFRKIADTLDEVQNVIDDETLSADVKEERQEELLGKFAIQLVKISSKMD